MASGARQQKGFSMKEVLKFMFETLEGDENKDDNLERKEESSDSIS